MIGDRLITLPIDIIKNMVGIALTEDVGYGDISAQIIPTTQNNHAHIITREFACICGVAWVDEVFKQLSSTYQHADIDIQWQVKDGDKVQPNTILCTLYGNARSLLTGERTALNFLQTLSATATATWNASQLITHAQTKLLDTRKTIPSFRLAQKYAVACGGGYNHRLGLYDAFLIKENHIAAAGSVTQAIINARVIDNTAPIEIEVENLQELYDAIAAHADIVMLDDFSFEDMHTAVAYNIQQIRPVKLEVSGNVDIGQLKKLCELGVDFISSGALTKHIQAIDLSMRIIK
jgi:nicotinate-nucleotide pyrophosphorylase (carboxylating)